MRNHKNNVDLTFFFLNFSWKLLSFSFRMDLISMPRLRIMKPLMVGLKLFFRIETELIVLSFLDICEDPEMKSRIAALRSEQEIRARAGNQKTRRSQSTSTNTRTHSIRRNSTRDKGQISKRQIKNEAIFVIHQDVRIH
jgi:hypothetical protein